MIFHSPTLDAQEVDVLRKINELRRNLGYSLSAPLRWHGILRKVAFARAVRGSNSIEGYNVSVDDAVAAVEGEEPLDAETETWAAIVGYRQAMTYVLQLADDPHFRFSADLIRSLHFMIISYDLSKKPGRWRPGGISVVDDETGEEVHQGPPAAMVPSLMTELVASLNETNQTDGTIKAAMAHLNLAMIHPFSDGNGRMARCLQTLVLARTGILAPPFSSIEEYLGRNTRAYYDVLAEVGKGSWNPENDTKSWIRFSLKAHFTQAATLVRRFRKMQELWDALEQRIKKRRLPERTILALADAAIGLRVRNIMYRDTAEVSSGLASRDLKALVDNGFLEAKGEKRGRFYVATPEIRALGTDSRESKRVADPFDEPDLVSGILPGMEGFPT